MDFLIGLKTTVLTILLYKKKKKYRYVAHEIRDMDQTYVHFFYFMAMTKMSPFMYCITVFQ